MSEKKIATRESYGAALVEYAAIDPDVVVLDADLAAATKTGMFKKAFPERFIDCGIAECNMIGVAAGLAAAGKKRHYPEGERRKRCQTQKSGSHTACCYAGRSGVCLPAGDRPYADARTLGGSGAAV